MAKNNINLGTLSGKLGDNVFWRTHGQQRVRTYFKRTETNVGYETGEQRSRFANLKSIYQWLPEPFRKACNLYRTGGNPYADFMRQYVHMNEGRDKEGFGAGRFLPVNCAVSNGTLPIQMQTKIYQCFIPDYVATDEVFQGIGFPYLTQSEIPSTIALFTQYLRKGYPALRDGDVLHVLLGYVFYDDTDWGEADVVGGFPFAYRKSVDCSFKLDSTDERLIDVATNGQIWLAKAGRSGDLVWCLTTSPNVQPTDAVEFMSVVGAVLVERPSNTRQLRFAPSKLMFDKSQLMILSPNMRGRWNDYAARSYMKE